MMQKGLANLNRATQAVFVSLPVLFRQPQLLKCWLLQAKKAQIVLVLAVLLVPLVAIPVTDALLEKLYPSRKVMGIFSKGDGRLPQRKHQARVLLWTLATGTVLTLLFLDAPKRARQESPPDAAPDLSPDGEGTLANARAEDFGIGPNGRYLLADELGRGAMGVVYRAFDRLLEREVAFKELPFQLALDTGRVDRFRQEARTLARLSHPGIVQVFDLVEDGGRIFLAMEFVSGGSLEEVLHESKALPLAVAARYGAAVAEALSYVHSRGVVHRDLKPANILVSQDDQPKITDFGIARFGGSQGVTVEGAIMGSPEYMSPEQATGKPVDAGSDVYSLGVLLYRIFTGTVPFAGDVSSVLAQQITCDPDAPANRTAGLPDEVSDLILALLRKNPEEREQDLGRVAQTLRLYAA